MMKKWRRKHKRRNDQLHVMLYTRQHNYSLNHHIFVAKDTKDHANQFSFYIFFFFFITKGTFSTLSTSNNSFALATKYLFIIRRSLFYYFHSAQQNRKKTCVLDEVKSKELHFVHCIEWTAQGAIESRKIPNRFSSSTNFLGKRKKE